LPIGYRTVFNLYCIEGYKHFEIAKMLGIKEATSRSQLNKAKNILKDKLTKIQEKDERRRI
jgi:RNA polymerase sigma-70 factor (ECF subfamily)